jgi:hypothetical protein
MQENILCEDLSLHPRDCADYCVSATEPTHTLTQREGGRGGTTEREQREMERRGQKEGQGET